MSVLYTMYYCPIKTSTSNIIRKKSRQVFARQTFFPLEYYVEFRKISRPLYDSRKAAAKGFNARIVNNYFPCWRPNVCGSPTHGPLYTTTRVVGQVPDDNPGCVRRTLLLSLLYYFLNTRTRLRSIRSTGRSVGR